ncbi:MAG: hypothetical protein ACRC8S_19380 [Fimbriiglobus sp.]
MFWIKKAIAGLLLSTALAGLSLSSGGNAAMAQADDKKAESRVDENPSKLRTAESRYKAAEANFQAAEAHFQATEAIYNKEKAELNRASEIRQRAAEEIRELRMLEERQKFFAATDRFEVIVTDGNGKAGLYNFLESKNGQYQLTANMKDVESLELLFKRCLADPNAPKKIVIDTTGLHHKNAPKMIDMSEDIKLVQVLRAAGVNEVHYQGYLPQKSIPLIGAGDLFTQREQFQVVLLDGTTPIKLSQYVNSEMMERFQRMEEYFKIRSFSKQASIVDTKGTDLIQIGHTPEAKLKVGDVMPVYYHGHQRDDLILKIHAYIKIVRINGDTAWAEEVTKSIDPSIKKPVVLEAYWLGFPIKR